MKIYHSESKNKDFKVSVDSISFCERSMIIEWSGECEKCYYHGYSINGTLICAKLQNKESCKDFEPMKELHEQKVLRANRL